MDLRKLTEKDVTFTVECEPEYDLPYVGNCMASGDDAADRKAEEWIRSELARGNEWAWCCVKVTARWGRYSGSDYLGGCSYRSEADFCQPGGYFDDMKNQALDVLNQEIARDYEQIKTLIG